MSLRERLKTKKEAKSIKKAGLLAGKFDISIKKVTEAITKIKNPADLGNIVKEFAKFLNTMDAKDSKITFSGNFDLGQRMLLNCMLANFLEDGSKIEDIMTEDETDNELKTKKAESKLVRRRKSIKEKLTAEDEE